MFVSSIPIYFTVKQQYIRVRSGSVSAILLVVTRRTHMKH
jgi:hypothetical protein